MLARRTQELRPESRTIRPRSARLPACSRPEAVDTAHLTQVSPMSGGTRANLTRFDRHAQAPMGTLRFRDTSDPRFFLIPNGLSMVPSSWDPCRDVDRIEREDRFRTTLLWMRLWGWWKWNGGNRRAKLSRYKLVLHLSRSSSQPLQHLEKNERRSDGAPTSAYGVQPGRRAPSEPPSHPYVSNPSPHQLGHHNATACR